jgi:hypothetical protein
MGVGMSSCGKEDVFDGLFRYVYACEHKVDALSE